MNTCVTRFSHRNVLLIVCSIYPKDLKIFFFHMDCISKHSFHFVEVCIADWRRERCDSIRNRLTRFVMYTSIERREKSTITCTSNIAICSLSVLDNCPFFFFFFIQSPSQCESFVCSYLFVIWKMSMYSRLFRSYLFHSFAYYRRESNAGVLRHRRLTCLCHCTTLI